jgi:hypothetical protein
MKGATTIMPTDRRRGSDALLIVCLMLDLAVKSPPSNVTPRYLPFRCFERIVAESMRLFHLLY